MGDIASSLDSESKQQLVECLKAGGYPVADVPFEKWDDSTTKAWLTSASSFFDATIGRNLSGQDLELAVAANYMPPTPVHPLCDAIQIFCNIAYRCLNPAYCEPERIEGDFVPDGEACECGTIGPWAYGCGRLTADARGKVTINIPYPPPLGTKLEFDVGVGASVDMCACVWVRRCMANSKRSVTLIREDCSRITFDEPGPRMQFEVYAWDFAFPSSQCQNAARPLSIPGPEEPCGLSAPGH